ELAVLKTRLADALEPPTNARRSAPDALPADLDDTVLGEEVHDVVPHLAVRVIAVGGLEISNAVFVVQRVDAVLQLLERRFGFGGRTGRRRDRDARGVLIEVIWNDGQVAAAPIGPALVIRA